MEAGGGWLQANSKIAVALRGEAVKSEFEDHVALRFAPLLHSPTVGIPLASVL